MHTGDVMLNICFNGGEHTALQCSRYLSSDFVEDRIEAMIAQGRITLVKRSDIPDFNGATILRVESR